MILMKREQGYLLHQELERNVFAPVDEWLHDDGLYMDVPDLQRLKAKCDAAVSHLDTVEGRSERSRVDGIIASHIHGCFKEYKSLLRKREFVLRLSYCELRHCIVRRLGKGGKVVPAEQNFGLESLRESYVVKMFKRGQIGYCEDYDDPYYLAKLGGDVDIWDSHIIDPEYGGLSVFGKTFIRFCFDSSCSYHRNLDRDRIRMLAVQVNRRYATYPLHRFSEDESVKFLGEVMTVVESIILAGSK